MRFTAPLPADFVPDDLAIVLESTGSMGHRAGDVQIVAEDGTPTQAWARTGGMTVLLEHPPTVAECVAFASDWANVLAAEAVAREVTGASRALWCIAPAADVAGRIMSISPRHSTAAVHALGYVVRSWSFHDVTLWCPALDGARA